MPETITREQLWELAKANKLDECLMNIRKYFVQYELLGVDKDGETYVPRETK